MDKQFTTVPEQIKLLRDRGLLIPDENFARKFLSDNNYYRISGYSLTLRNHDVFFPGTTFQNIVDIYSFDHELRHTLLKYLEQVEVKMKASFAHEFSRLYGPLGYLNSANFTNPAKFREIIGKSEQMKVTRTAHEAFLKHFAESEDPRVPLWAYVELFSFGDISMLYKISRLELQEKIAASFGFAPEKTWLLSKSMHLMTILRNLCAHGSRLFNRHFEQKPKLTKYEKGLLLIREDGEVDNAHLFSLILIVRHLINEEAFGELKREILDLCKKYPFVSMRYYGFPKDWENKI